MSLKSIQTNLKVDLELTLKLLVTDFKCALSTIGSGPVSQHRSVILKTRPKKKRLEAVGFIPTVVRALCTNILLTKLFQLVVSTCIAPKVLKVNINYA